MLSVSRDANSVEIRGSVDDMLVYGEKELGASTTGMLVRGLPNVSFGRRLPALLHAARSFDIEFVRSVNMSSSLIYDEKNTLLL